MRLFGDNPLLIIQTYPILCWFNIYRASWRRNWDAEGVWSLKPSGCCRRSSWGKGLKKNTCCSVWCVPLCPMVHPKSNSGSKMVLTLQILARSRIWSGLWSATTGTLYHLTMEMTWKWEPTTQCTHQNVQRFCQKNIPQGPGPRFCCCKKAHVQKKQWSRDAISKCLRFFQAQARNMGYQQKAEKSTTIRDGHWRRRHLPIVIEIHLEVHHIPYQMQPIISLRLGPREKHTCNSIMNVIPSGCHIWANTHIYIHIYIYICAKYTPSWPHAKWLWTASSTNQSPRPVHLGVIVLPTHEAKLMHRPPHLSDLNGHLAATAGCDNQQSQNTYRETTC